MKCFVLIQTRDNNWDVNLRSELEIKIEKSVETMSSLDIYDMSLTKNCTILYMDGVDINVLRRNFEGFWLDPRYKNKICKKNRYRGRLIISIIESNNKELEKYYNQSSLAVLYTNNITETIKDITLMSTIDSSRQYKILIQGEKEFDEKKLIGLAEMILKNKIIYPQNREIHY